MTARHMGHVRSRVNLGRTSTSRSPVQEPVTPLLDEKATLTAQRQTHTKLSRTQLRRLRAAGTLTPCTAPVTKRLCTTCLQSD